MILLSELLSKVTQKEIMEHYYHCSIIDRKPVYRNMMRNDNEGTCYFNWYKNKYYLVDRARGIEYNFDCFDLVKFLYNCNFAEALEHINKDMNLGLSNQHSIISNKRRKINNDSSVKETSYKRKINYQVTSRNWNNKDVEYWSKFNISTDTLTKFNVVPVKLFKSDSDDYINFKLKYKYNEEDPCYAFIFKRKNKVRVKLYRPFNSILKWQGNITSSDIFGYDQLPDYTNTIYICSSLKDLMCLYEMGLTAIAPQSETTDIPNEILDDLKNRCNKLIILFDNDSAGISQSKKYALKYSCRYIELPTINNCKDVAEFVESIGIEETKKIIIKSKLKFK